MAADGQGLRPVGAVAHPINRHALAAQGNRQAAADHAVILDQQDAHWHPFVSYDSRSAGSREHPRTFWRSRKAGYFQSLSRRDHFSPFCRLVELAHN